MTNNTPQIRLINEKPITTSRGVSQFFGRRHEYVVKKIKTLECSEDFRCANFSAHPYINPQNGETYTEYLITRDGFTFLAMGFTGKKAAQFKEAYIKAFNDMEAQIQKQQLSNQKQESQLTGIAALTERDKQNLKQAVGVFVDCLAAKRPIFEIRALIQYISNSANEFNWDQAINDYLPFGLDRVMGLLADNEVVIVDAGTGHKGIELRKVNTQQYDYIAKSLEGKNSTQYHAQIC